MTVIALHNRNPVFNTRPLPRRDKPAIISGDFRGKLLTRGWVTPHEFNILGVLYSSVWMGRLAEAKTVDHGAFASAGLSVTYDDVLTFVNKKWVTREAAGVARWKLTAAGSVSYDILYFAEEDGLYPLQRPTPKSPDEILADRHSRITDPLDSRRPSVLADGENAQYTEILRTLSYLVDRQKEHDRMLKSIISGINHVMDAQKGPQQ